MVQARRKSYRARDNSRNSHGGDVARITAGSKSEGFSLCFESDYDRLNIYKSVLCICGQCGCQNQTSEMDTIFKLHGEKCHPGHFNLRLLRVGSRCHKTVERAITCFEGEIYVSSEKFTDALQQELTFDINGGWKRCTRTGPALPSTRGLYSRDDVFAFRCPCQRHLLRVWEDRRRRFGWPGQELIAAVLAEEADIAPVSCPNSENKAMEWRVCFIQGERLLTDSFSETVYKLYILLKMIHKHVFKPICNGLSSYVMKNITFWMAEDNPNETFTNENIVHVLWLSLHMLHKAIKTSNLPYYMIPSRNLLAGKLTPNEHRNLLEVIEISMNDIPRLIQHLPKLSASFKVPTQVLLEESRARDDLETLELLRQDIISAYWRPDLQREEVDVLCWADARYRNSRLKMYDIVWPEWCCQFRPEVQVDLASVLHPATDDQDAFKERYMQFAESYYDIIWPHMKPSIEAEQHDLDTDSIPRQKIITIMAILRLKIEQALS
ncbi:uncharacterized protein LOC128237437 isoform X2 [Mya arenaria]|nr:uncharacterized protein LOC128237437 isoform X2 [Mya arenaria]XP_052808939.1 uncharacterized protein LOC128237437 isoform X2 [Mya arenaria]XP_052808940.1 uncharacterized protein LOC128237437 isoform X2 [Mya arenaria]